MRILILNSIMYTPQNGVIPKLNSIKESMAYNLAHAFSAEGHTVTLIAAVEYKPVYDEDYPFSVLFFKSNIPNLFLPSVLPLHASLPLYLWRNRKSFDMVISSELFSLNSLFSALVLGHRTVVWQELGQHNRKMRELPSRIWYNVVVRCLIRRALVVPRSYRAGRFVSQFGVKLCEDVIDNCVDTSNLRTCRDKYRQMIVVSRLVAPKHVDDIVRRFAGFIRKEEYSDIRLYIVGDGEERRNIMTLIRELGVGSSVVMLGRLSHAELSDYLSHSMCLLCNSERELNAMVISEAIYSGTPVVTNTVPYSSETVDKLRLGIARDDWDETDLRAIVDDNAVYVDNCIKYSGNLTIESVVGRFVKIGETL